MSQFSHKNLNIIGSVVTKNRKGSEIIYSIYYGFIEPELADDFTANIKAGNLDYFDNINKNYSEGLIGFYIVNTYQKKDSVKVPTFVKSGKNLGKKNATSIQEQTIKQATSILDKYKRNNSVDSELYPPMLASKYDEKNNLETVMVDNLVLDREYFIEYKFDGNRAVAFYKNNKLTVYSRERKIIYPHKFLESELNILLRDYPGLYLDGELYLHGESLQTITGQVRKQNPNDVTIFYKFYVFDIFDPNNISIPYCERREKLESIIPKENPYIIIVDTILTDDNEKAKELYISALHNKYEGLMLKYPNAPYEYSYKNYHSKYIRKIKPSTRREYKIVGFELGKGKNAKAVTLKLTTDDNKIFNCTIKNTLEYKEALYELWKDEDYFNKNVLGKLATVEFQSLSDDGIPLRGVVIELLL